MEIKRLEGAEVEAALAAAEASSSRFQPEVAESICEDILAVEPDNERALEILFWSRILLLKKGLPKGVEKTGELLPRFRSDFDRAYFGGVMREQQARFLLERRGKQSSFVAYSWFRHAMDDFEEASAKDPSRLEPKLHWNACFRTLQANPQCIPAPEDAEEHGIE